MVKKVRRKLKVRAILIIFLVLIVFIFVISVKLSYNKEKKVCLYNSCFSVEIADTPELRAQGLMHRTNLDSNKGMLFIFEQEAIYPFWMKNTFIPLDMIWINSTFDIVFIKENARPCSQEPCESIVPTQKALYVLELNAGKAREAGLAIGNKLDFSF
ncbi:MAG: DUF192 domain-containing protein [archaeon]